MKQHRQETLAFWIYIVFIISVWCVYFAIFSKIIARAYCWFNCGNRHDFIICVSSANFS